jgi:hypothetical protein
VPEITPNKSILLQGDNVSVIVKRIKFLNEFPLFKTGLKTLIMSQGELKTAQTSLQV